MYRLRNIAMLDYQKRVITELTDAGHSDPYVLLRFAGDTKSVEKRAWIDENLISLQLRLYRTRQIILYPAKATLRQPQIKQYTASKEEGVTKPMGTSYNFDIV